MQWMFVAPRSHSVVSFDSAGTLPLGLFDSGPRTLASYFTFTAAGAYNYRSTVTRDGSTFAGADRIAVLGRLGARGEPTPSAGPPREASDLFCPRP